MNGEKDLSLLLKNICPRLNAGEYVFCCVDDATVVDLTSVVCTVREQEGLTVILSRQKADEMRLPYTFISAWITLTVHSALDAVGLTAAFSTALAREGISCNVIAGVHHDHIFVAAQDAERAMSALRDLTR